MKHAPFKYDIALSFAGQDRNIARTIADSLKKRNITVFYDSDEITSLWGQNLYDRLTSLYSREARFALILVSGHYAKKRWTKLERQAIQARAFLQDEPYLLPLKLDDTELDELLPTIGHVEWTGDPEYIADLVLAKLGIDSESATKPTVSPAKRSAFQLDFLSSPEQQRLHDFRERFLEKNKSILLIGPQALTRSGMPNTRQLACSLAKHSGMEKKASFYQVCDDIQNIHGHAWLRRNLAKLLDDKSKPLSDVHQIVARMPFSHYLTTNTDRFMEWAIKDAGRSCTPIFFQPDLALLQESKIPVIKFYGTIEHPHTLVWNYKDFSPDKEAFANLIRHLTNSAAIGFQINNVTALSVVGVYQYSLLPLAL